MNPQKVKLLLLVWKIPSVAFQLYVGSLIATAGSQQEPFLNLVSLAHLGAAIVTCRGIDALLDMTVGSLVHVNTEEHKEPPKPVESAPATTDIQS